MRSRVILSAVQTALLLSGSAVPLVAQEYGGAETPCRVPAVMASCPRSVASREPRALAAGEAPVYLLAAVQLIQAPSAWRTIYHQVERCAGAAGDYDAISWAVMGAPLQSPTGPTYGFTIGRRIVLVRGDTTYLRHEMLHHILAVSGWRPPTLRPGESYSIVDLHPIQFFGPCTGDI